MPELAVGKAVVQASETLEAMAQSAAHLKSSVSEAVDENVHHVRRALRRGLHGAQDLIDNATYKIKRHPFEAVAITAGAAFAMGLLVGWTARDNRRRW
jgi:ElaB/YqjD/DUF883 family membrane-anchored ribosome-binding protein